MVALRDGSLVSEGRYRCYGTAQESAGLGCKLGKSGTGAGLAVIV